MLHPPYAILACDVFSDELIELGGDPPPWRALEFLEMGLHDQPDKLRQKIQQSIHDLESDREVQAIVLAYGRCGNGLVGIRAQRCPLILPQAHDCISILLGGREAHDAQLKKTPGTYFYSPGWVRGKRVPGPDREAYLREFYAERYADDEDMIDELVEVDRDAFEHHNCAAYVSIVDRPATADYCKDCAKHMQWEHTTLKGDPSFLQDLLNGNWQPTRFLTVEPGQCVAADVEGNLVAID